MNLSHILKTAEKFTKDNSPMILTAVGVAGTITTAYLAGKASFKAAKKIQDREFYLRTHETVPLGETTELETMEKVKLVWSEYIPAVGIGTMTITAIVFANRIGTKRTAALAAAYSLSERAYDEYKEKVAERIGTNKEQKIRDEVAQDRVDRTPSSQSQVYITGGGEVLCFDQFTGRYFMSTVEAIKRAQNDINYRMLNHGYASLGDFYDKIGLPSTSFAEEVGWTSDTKLELLFSTTLSDDQKPCVSIDFNVSPIRNYARCWGE